MSPNMIRFNREFRGGSRSHLAELIGVGDLSIYNWENGHYCPSEENYDELLVLFGKYGPHPGYADIEERRRVLTGWYNDTNTLSPYWYQLAEWLQGQLCLHENGADDGVNEGLQLVARRMAEINEEAVNLAGWQSPHPAM
jgi:DNA-binding XRE family transcriptional regulator